MNGYAVLFDAIGLLIPLIQLGCAVVCLCYLRVSKMLLIAAAGFGLASLGNIVTRGYSLIMMGRPRDINIQQVISFFNLGCFVFGFAAVMLGLFLALSEAHRKLSSSGSGPWIT